MTKVLVVEDDPLNMELVVEIANEMGFTADKAVGAKEAIEIAEKTVYDLIIMDIQLPGMDGIVAMGIIKSKTGNKRTPVIALTAFAMKGDRERFLETGFDEYMPKPIDVPAFMKILERYRNL